MSNKKSAASKDVRQAKTAAKLASKEAKKLYREKVKEMRPFLKSLKNIDLRHNLSASQKGFVTKAWNEYEALTKRPTRVYRTKSKSRLKMAQDFGAHSGKVKFDVAFLPSQTTGGRVTFKGDQLILKSKYVDEMTVRFNMRRLVENPEDELRRAIKRHPDAQYFVIQAGEYLFNGTIHRDLIQEKTLQLMQRYSPGGAGYEKRGENSHYSNWLFGLRAYHAKNQKDIGQYVLDYKKAAQTKLKKRKNVKRRQRQGFKK